jgi:tight adherence protein B
MESLLNSSDMIYVYYTLIALGSFLVFTGMIQLFTPGESGTETRSRRMRMIAKGANTATILALLKPAQSGGSLSRLPLFGDLPKLILQAGFSIRPARFLFVCGVIASLSLFLMVQFFAPIQAIALAGFVGFILPMLILRSRRTERTQALVRQLPDALDLLARGLRVGHPLNTSIGAVAEQMADPVGSEFGIVFDQISFGDDLVDAFQEFAERVDLEDVHYLSASIGIQHGSGGDLARVIQVLSTVIRSRIAMRRKIKAISAEGRLTAWFLSTLPFLIFGFTSYSSPGYYSGVMADPMFKPMAAMIIVFTVLNALAMKKLVSFRI